MKVRITITLDVDADTYPLAEGVTRTAAAVRNAVRATAIATYQCGAENTEGDAEAAAITDWSWS